MLVVQTVERIFPPQAYPDPKISVQRHYAIANSQCHQRSIALCEPIERLSSSGAWYLDYVGPANLEPVFLPLHVL